MDKQQGTRADLEAVEARYAAASQAAASAASAGPYGFTVLIAASAADVPTLVDELRAARELVEAGGVMLADLRQIRAKVANLLARVTTMPGPVAQALRDIHTDLDIAVAAYTEALGR